MANRVQFFIALLLAVWAAIVGFLYKGHQNRIGYVSSHSAACQHLQTVATQS